MKKKVIVLCILLCALVLEALPYGAVCNFGNPEGESFRETYSYFSLIPYGYANFAPLITAVLTCVLLLIIIIAVIFKKDLGKKTATLAAIASLISLCPMLPGISYFSAVGALISLCLVSTTVVIAVKNNYI
jgi:hypothetical protein